MKLTGLAILCVASGMCACVSGGGGTGTYWDRTHGGENGNNTALTAFTGSWSFVSGTSTSACGGGQPSMSPASGTLTVEQSAPAEVRVSGGGTSCPARFTISGNQGFLVPNQPCTSEVGAIHLDAGHLALADGTLEYALDVSATDGQQHCTFDVSGTLRRP